MTTSLKAAMALLAAASLSCSEDQDQKVCAPGATQVCVCPGGATGAQVCQQDGQSWGTCNGCPSLDAGGGGADGAPATDVGSGDGPAQCSTAVDLLNSAACGAGKACSIVDSDGKLGCATPGTTGFHQTCADLSACVAGSGCLGPSVASLTCLPFCKSGSTGTCPKGSACTGTFKTAVGEIGLCLLNATCDIVAGTGCAGALGCYVGDSKGNPVCVAAGATTAGGGCSVSNDCLPGLVCSKSVCRKLCHGDGDCSGPETCSGVGLVFSAAPTVGICMP